MRWMLAVAVVLFTSQLGAAPRAKPPAKAKPPAQDEALEEEMEARREDPSQSAKLIGSWSVTMTAKSSSCDHIVAGSVHAMQWVINETDYNQVSIKTVGSDTMSAAYAGSIAGNRLRAVANNGGHHALVELDLAKDKMSGFRMVANVIRGGACAILYDVSARKL